MEETQEALLLQSIHVFLEQKLQSRLHAEFFIEAPNGDTCFAWTTAPVPGLWWRFFEADPVRQLAHQFDAAWIPLETLGLGLAGRTHHLWKLRQEGGFHRGYLRVQRGCGHRILWVLGGSIVPAYHPFLEDCLHYALAQWPWRCAQSLCRDPDPSRLPAQPKDPSHA